MKLRQILTGIGTVLVLLAFVWSIFTYLGRYALCEDVKKEKQEVEQKIDGVNKKVDKTIEMMQYSFKEFQLESKEKRISEIEKKAGKDPRDPIIAETLEQLKKDKIKLEKEMRKIEEKK